MGPSITAASSSVGWSGSVVTWGPRDGSEQDGRTGGSSGSAEQVLEGLDQVGASQCGLAGLASEVADGGGAGRSFVLADDHRQDGAGSVRLLHLGLHRPAVEGTVGRQSGAP